MACDNSAKARRRIAAALEREKKRKKRDRQRKIRVLVGLVCMVAAFTASLCLDSPETIPKHTSILTGQKWLSELLDGHPDHFRDQLGMAKHVFIRLIVGDGHRFPPMGRLSKRQKLARTAREAAGARFVLDEDKSSNSSDDDTSIPPSVTVPSTSKPKTLKAQILEKDDRITELETAISDLQTAPSSHRPPPASA
ncbi:hypothetical protein B0H11DRAFT_2315797 [Mycena galericulata]|nr:hypothetical protein B0H11DRAFT_2315797 [Mycena galericulata]